MSRKVQHGDRRVTSAARKIAQEHAPMGLETFTIMLHTFDAGHRKTPRHGTFSKALGEKWFRFPHRER